MFDKRDELNPIKCDEFVEPVDLKLKLRWTKERWWRRGKAFTRKQTMSIKTTAFSKGSNSQVQ